MNYSSMTKAQLINQIKDTKDMEERHTFLLIALFFVASIGFAFWFFPLAMYIHLGILGLMKDSTPSLFINYIMALTFESTHEYYLKDAQIWYCEEHSGLVISRDYEDRVVIDGVKPETMLKFAQELVKKNLEKQVTPKKKTTSTK